MQNSITFSTGELVSMILGICAAICTISAALGVITRAIAKAKEPEAQQNARLEAIEKRLDDISVALLKNNDENTEPKCLCGVYQQNKQEAGDTA